MGIMRILNPTPNRGNYYDIEAQDRLASEWIGRVVQEKSLDVRHRNVYAVVTESSWDAVEGWHCVWRRTGFERPEGVPIWIADQNFHNQYEIGSSMTLDPSTVDNTWPGYGAIVMRHGQRYGAPQSLREGAKVAAYVPPGDRVEKRAMSNGRRVSWTGAYVKSQVTDPEQGLKQGKYYRVTDSWRDPVSKQWGMKFAPVDGVPYGPPVFHYNNQWDMVASPADVFPFPLVLGFTSLAVLIAIAVPGLGAALLLCGLPAILLVYWLPSIEPVAGKNASDSIIAVLAVRMLARHAGDSVQQRNEREWRSM